MVLTKNRPFHTRWVLLEYSSWLTPPLRVPKDHHRTPPPHIKTATGNKWDVKIIDRMKVGERGLSGLMQEAISVFIVTLTPPLFSNEKLTFAEIYVENMATPRNII